MALWKISEKLMIGWFVNWGFMMPLELRMLAFGNNLEVMQG